MDKKEIVDEIMSRVMQKIDDLESQELKKEVKEAPSCCSCASSTNNSTTALYEKKLMSEKNVLELKEKGVLKILYKKGTIVTEAAKDIAKKHKIEIEKMV